MKIWWKPFPSLTISATRRSATPARTRSTSACASIAVVDDLEEHYGAFNGLNLCFETREGILKHCSRENARRLGALGERFLEGRQPSIEAQIANVADEIAYNNHDVDDGLRSGLLTVEQLAEVELWQTHYEAARGDFPQIEGRRLIHETVRPR